ncbi:MAG: UDP-N-acetylglucosamine 1-carboxyvinyltransferase [Deltaproteobacteria bacterium]|jgi:UDP-N-acetylglucosamine 1-carboxyvinyltransferase|nr:UDP-N-acetylglucosamine 1-carboxyvinyltransferase [Deltaproteobacteria bacterium]
MDKLVVEGGRPLSGTVKVSGAKNAALPLMAASILCGGPLILENLPRLGDLKTMGLLLRHMGGEVDPFWEKPESPAGDSGPDSPLSGPGPVSLDMSSLRLPEAPHELVKTMRASALVLGPLLARFGRARVALPGGCAIGVRPIDMHLKALKEMGTEFDLSGGDIVATAPKGGLRGAEIRFDTVSVTGTENIMMAAALARGRTIISNAAREPEITDTGEALIRMGADIEGLGTDEIVVNGRDSLHGASHRVMPDRIECGTLMAALALAGGRIRLEGAPLECLKAVTEKFAAAGLKVDSEGSVMDLERAEERLRPVDVTTLPYPGFPTDMQAQFMAMMTLASGASIITETIFENRFMHVAELRRLGADITLEGRSAVVKGVAALSGAPLTASDLRASACLLLAALAAGGKSQIHRVYHLDRGYDRLDGKLNLLGARIKRMRA